MVTFLQHQLLPSFSLCVSALPFQAFLLLIVSSLFAECSSLSFYKAGSLSAFGCRLKVASVRENLWVLQTKVASTEFLSKSFVLHISLSP